MTIAAYSATASEAEYIRKGRFKLYFENDLLNISDGINIISLDLSHSALINWTPDTTCLYPAFPNGSALTTLNNLLSSIINNIELNTGEISYKSDLDHTHTTTDITDLLTWFNNKKPELKGDDGRDGQDGKSAFELWQLDIYGNIEPKNTQHPNNWQYIDPSGFGDKSNVRLLTYRNEYESRLNLFMKETGKNALELEDKADEILNTIDYGMTEEEIQAIRDRANEKLNEITEGMTDEEVEAITNEANAILATINYGMTQEQIQEIQNQYAAKKAEWINWQQDKHYDFSLIFKEISGYPGDNPTEWELRQYTYRLYQAGDINAGTVQNIGDIEQAQTTAERAEETAKTAKKLGIAGTVLGAIGTVFGIGNTAAEVVSYSALQSQIAALTASMGTIQSSYLLNNFDEFSDVITESYDDITGTGGIWSKIGNFFKNIWENITGLRVGYTEIGEVMSEGGEILADVDAVLLGVRAIRTRDLSEPIQHYTLTEDFTKWYIQEYPSMNSILSAIKLIFESNNYDYTTKEASLRIIYLIAAELLDKIETNETHTHTISEITDYTPYNDTEIRNGLTSLNNRVSIYEDHIIYNEEEEIIEEEEEEAPEGRESEANEEETAEEEEQQTTRTIIYHPEIIFNGIENIKKIYNNETKTIAYAEEVAPLNHNHDSAYAAINHNHNSDYATINHNHNSDYAALNHNHDSAYADINHTHTTFTDITVSTLNGLTIDKTTTGMPQTPFIPVVKTDGVMEIGKYLDFHRIDTPRADYNVRLTQWNNYLQCSGILTASNLTADNNTRLSAAETAITGKADINHNHDTAYAAINHNHDTDYAAINHNHDTDYAALSHTHTLSEITDYTAPTPYDDTQLRTLISSKADSSMLTALTARVAIVETGKADINHNHDTEYAAINHNHDTEYAAINHNHDTEYAAINHTHSEYVQKSDIITTPPTERHYLTLLSDRLLYENNACIEINGTTATITIINDSLKTSAHNVYFSFVIRERIYSSETSLEFYDITFNLDNNTSTITQNTFTLYNLTIERDGWVFTVDIDTTENYTSNYIIMFSINVDSNVEEWDYGGAFKHHIETKSDLSNTDIGTTINNSILLMKTEILKTIYPVGSIYTSMNNMPPYALFGFGVWIPIKDRFLYCSSNSQQTGGSKTITVNNLPSHSHTFSGTTGGGGSHSHEVWFKGWVNCDGSGKHAVARSRLGGDDDERGSFWTNTTGDHTHGFSGNTDNTGSGQDYMPPYITVYAWFRSA